MASLKPVVMSQKDYLKKYLNPKSGDKKRKKKKKSAKVLNDKRSIIVDDDDVKTMRTLEDDELDLFQLAEDAPQIAGIIDERPDELRTLETFRSSARWRVVADEDGIEDVKVMALGQKVLPTLVGLQPNNDDDDNDLSPERANKYSSEESPPRKKKQEETLDHSSQRKNNPSLNDDISPPRRKSKWNTDSEKSPPRKNKMPIRKEDVSPHSKIKHAYGSPSSRRADEEKPLHSRTKKHHSDSDTSPPRNSKSQREDNNSDSDASIARNRKPHKSSRNKRQESHSDSDASPLRHKSGPKLSSSKRKETHSDSDASPPRHKTGPKLSSSKRMKPDYDSDASPPRHKMEPKLSYRPSKRKETSSDSDEPPLRHKNGSKVTSSKRKETHSDSDPSPPRHQKGSKLSHTKRKVTQSDSDESPPPSRREKSPTTTKRRANYDSDASPPRNRRGQKSSERSEVSGRNQHVENRDKRDGISGRDKRYTDDKSKRQHQKYDSDTSPVVRGRYLDSHAAKTGRGDSKHKTSSKRLKEQHSDSDESSRRPRKENVSRSMGSSGLDVNRRSDKTFRPNTKPHNYPPDVNISDESPPRRKKRRSQSPRRKENFGSHLSDDNVSDESSPREIVSKHKPRHGEHKHNSSTRGRETAQVLDDLSSRKDNSKFMPPDRREEPSTSSGGKPNSRKVVGDQQAPIFRDRKTGRIRNLEEEAKAKEEESQKTNETLEKYTRWGKGLAQVAAAKERLQDALHEMSKPVARYADDDDLDQMLRAQDREGDPMLDYIRSKSVSCAVASKPKYQGSWMPNRFNIPPGHRWDGVDRSSGYEKQWFEQINARKAMEEEAHKWSMSDM